MKRRYVHFACSNIVLETELGFLAASQEDAINENTEVTIDKQVGGEEIVFDKWEE